MALQPGQEVVMIDVDRRQPFIDYIREQKVHSDKNLAEQLICRAKSYVLVGDKLYRWSATSGVVGDSHKGPLNNRGKTHFLSQIIKYKQTLKT
jgi:hypothetical protein